MLWPVYTHMFSEVWEPLWLDWCNRITLYFSICSWRHL